MQLIRRPGRQRRLNGAAATATGDPATEAGTPDGQNREAGPPGGSIFAGWTAGAAPWLRRGDLAGAEQLTAELAGLSEGRAPAFGAPVAGPLFLVCAHGRRNACCARFGGPLARTLAQQHPGQVWETTHVGGHRFAANLVIFPHGLYYGPVTAASADAAISAYRRGEVAPDRYRGRAGQPRDVQAADYARLRAGPARSISDLA